MKPAMFHRPFLLRGVLALAGPLAACAVRSERRGEAPASVGAKAVPAPVTLHVLALKAFVYREPHRKQPPFVSLRIAAPVVVALETTPGEGGVPFRRVLEGEGAGGVVPQEDLGDVPPSAPATLEQEGCQMTRRLQEGRKVSDDS